VGKVSTFSVYGVKLHLFLCATNRVLPCYELPSADVTEGSVSKESLAEAKLGEEVPRELLRDLDYRSLPERAELEDTLAELGVLLLT
jgi:hypothetical protein